MWEPRRVLAYYAKNPQTPLDQNRFAREGCASRDAWALIRPWHETVPASASRRISKRPQRRFPRGVRCCTFQESAERLETVKAAIPEPPGTARLSIALPNNQWSSAHRTVYRPPAGT